MKSAIAFVAVLAVASAQFFNQNRRPGFSATPQPQRPLAAAPIRGSSEAAANTVRYENTINPDGGFNYAFETDNGISAQAQGTPKSFPGNPPLVPVVIQGSYSYTSPEGEPIVLNYIADENGYQPSSNILPTPPPIPPQIQRALEYIARNPQRQ